MVGFKGVSLVVLTLFAFSQTSEAGLKRNIFLKAFYDKAVEYANETPVPNVPKPFNDFYVKGSYKNSIHGWYTKKDDGPVMIYHHGNGLNLGGLHKYRMLEALYHVSGGNLVVWDYPAYGKSKAIGFSEAKNMDAAKVVFNKVKEKVKELKIKNLHDLSSILGQEASYYIDFSHIDEQGNVVVAARIAKDLRKIL